MKILTAKISKRIYFKIRVGSKGEFQCNNIWVYNWWFGKFYLHGIFF